jgi:CRISPR/Cas system CSM-associated protein Csm4 (group 5 of RAMP superfamily)
MKKEVKIEDFIDLTKLESMSEREREIYDSVFQLNKNKLQELTDVLELLEEFKNKHNSESKN